MSQFKKQIIGAVCATLLTIVAVFAFGVIAQSYSAGFGEFAKQSTQLAIEKHFGKYVAVLLISTIVLCAMGFAKTKLIKPLYVIWGILICGICFVICMHTGKYMFFDGTSEIEALVVQATRLFAFIFGVVFPLLHLILCIQACDNSLKSNTINQVITMLIFLILFWILTYIVGIIVSGIYQEMTIAACLSAIITIFPAMSMNSIRQQLKTHRH